MIGLLIISLVTAIITSFLIGVVSGSLICYLIFKDKIKKDITNRYILIEKPIDIGND